MGRGGMGGGGCKSPDGGTFFESEGDPGGESQGRNSFDNPVSGHEESHGGASEDM